MPHDGATVFIVDDSVGIRSSLSFLLRSAGYATEEFSSAEEFLGRYDRERTGCLVLDLQMPGMSGLQLLERLAAKGDSRPVIMITGHGDVPTAVRAIKTGAVDFLQKPFRNDELLERVRQSVGLDAEWRQWHARSREILARMEDLTPREREIFDLVVDGRSVREIAEALRLGQRTVEGHRRRLMQKMGAGSIVDLVRMASVCRRLM